MRYLLTVSLGVVLAGTLLAPATAGYYALVVDEQTHGTPSATGTPDGTYDAWADCNDTWAEAYASVPIAIVNAEATASGGATWHRKWQWQPDGMWDFPGVWHTHGDVYRQGALSCSLQNPAGNATAYAEATWDTTYYVSRTATAQNPTQTYTMTAGTTVRTQRYASQSQVDSTYYVGVSVQAKRQNCVDPCAGAAESGANTLVQESMAAHTLHQGEP